MPAKQGDHLGGIDSIEALRQRCVCTSDGCWHLRSARGRPMPVGRTHVIFVHGRQGNMSAIRAAWMMHTGGPVKSSIIVARQCESYDCVNPAHLKGTTRGALNRSIADNGGFNTPARQQMMRNLHSRRELKVTAELKRWVLESGQSDPDAAHALSVATSWVNTIRRRARVASPWGVAA